VTVGVGAGGGASPSSNGKLQTALLPRIALAAASYALAACARSRVVLTMYSRGGHSAKPTADEQRQAEQFIYAYRARSTKSSWRRRIMRRLVATGCWLRNSKVGYWWACSVRRLAAHCTLRRCCHDAQAGNVLLSHSMDRSLPLRGWSRCRARPGRPSLGHGSQRRTCPRGACGRPCRCAPRPRAAVPAALAAC